MQLTVKPVVAAEVKVVLAAGAEEVAVDGPDEAVEEATAITSLMGLMF
jgi:hypothetical protein